MLPLSHRFFYLGLGCLWATLSLGSAQETLPLSPPNATNTEILPINPKSPNELKSYPLTRYDEQVRKSPFAFEIFSVEKPPEIDPFADFVLTGYTIDHSKGVTYATIKDVKTNECTVINSREQHRKLGLQVTSLSKGSKLSEAVISVRKGTTEGEIRADEKSINMKTSVAGVGYGPNQRRLGPPPGMFNPSGVAPSAAPNVPNANGAPTPPGLPQPMVTDGNGNPIGGMPQNPIPQNGIPNPGTPAPNFIPGGGNVNNNPDPLAGQSPQPANPPPSGRRRVILPPPILPPPITPPSQ